MCRILVFSKDRPMQLHAYLESLFWFSNIVEKQVSVLYCHKDNISYDKVKTTFPNVEWVKEIDFEKQVREWIDGNEDAFTMFGCDDVLFKGKFDFQEIETFMEDNEEIFGVSIRLGSNLAGFPRHSEVKGKFCLWDWKADKPDNFHYPWELDCTIYRTDDVKDIMKKNEKKISNPNYLEEFVELNPNKYIIRNKMSCYNERGKAVVITINRVQNTHCNPIDDSMQTDPETLGYLYNVLNYKLDIKKIAKKRNKVVHVGASYFILFPKLKFHRKKKIGKYLKTFITNVIYLSTVDLKREGFNEFVGEKDAEIFNMINNFSHPKIMTPEETVALLARNPKSFVRFGDGELSIMTGKSIAFQEYNPELQAYLIELIKNSREDIYIGIPYFYFFPVDNLTSVVSEFVKISGKKFRSIINEYASQEKAYIDTTITQVYQTYKDYEFSKYYDQIRNLFLDKKVSLVIGEGIYESYTHNLFERAAEFELICAPKMNAYTELRKIIDEVSLRDIDRLICIVLGPTAKAIAVELTNKGYMVWDIGHLIKDYNQYMNGIPRTKETITNFYKPD